MGRILTGSGVKRIAPPAAEEPQSEADVDPLTLSPFSYEYQPRPTGKWRVLSVMGMAQLGDNGFWADVEYAVGHGDGYVDWPTSDPNAYALQCDGESMLPRIRPGKFVIIEPGNPIQPGDEVMVRSKDGRVMVKEFLFKANGKCHLASVNAAHGRVSILIEEIEKMHYVSGIAKPSKWRPD
ncbi:S24 family peptidase [Paraburkholderia bannensis]|uniref:S24 family peptidase n=1 Tax=Paraburkholderia bannensis TaxID=765414 RepID=UPI002AB29C94|nr:S24 family peptidase [Paraburkholderia bannensis]